MFTVTFTQDELNALASLLDVAVKATGIQGAKAAVPLYDKLERAATQANAPASPPRPAPVPHPPEVVAPASVKV